MGIGIVYKCFEFIQEFSVARGARACLLTCSEVFVGKHRQFSRRAVLVVAGKKLTDLCDVFARDGGLPLTQRARGGFEFCFGGHIAPAERGVGERFRDEGAAALRLLDIVLASRARVEAFSS